ncbi:MAG TPA: flippase [Ktedonobacteraceae bacterium]|nr:flippase [Ktedonobacteraceae bacterium]
MNNPRTGSPRPATLRRSHRMKLVPVSDAIEKQATQRMKAIQQVDVQPQPQPQPQPEIGRTAVDERRVRSLDTPHTPPSVMEVRIAQDGTNRGTLQWSPEQTYFDIDERTESRFDTIPMVVLKDIAKQQDKPALKMQSEISGAASNAGFVGLSNIFGYILKYANNILYQRGLGIEYYGLYTLSTAVVTLIGTVLTLGLDDAMIRYIAIYRGKKQPNLLRGLTIFCSALAGIAGLIGAILVIYFAPAIAHFENKPDITPFLQVLGSTIPLMILTTIWAGGLQGFKDFKKRAILGKILLPFIGFLLVLIVVIFFRSLYAILIITVVGTLLAAIGNLYFFFQRFAKVYARKEKPTDKPEEYATREWFGFAAPNFLTTVVGVVLDSIDTLLLGYFAVSVIALGQYGAAIKVTALIGMPLNALNTMFAPTIAELHSRGEHDKLAAMFKIVTKWSVTFSLPIFWVTVLFAVPFLSLSGNAFISAWPLVMVFAVGGIVSASTGSVGYMLLMTGRVKLSFLNSLAAIIANVIFGLILTPRYGAMGIAVATVLAILVVNAMRVLQVHLLLKMQPYRLDVLKPIAASLIAAALIGIPVYAMSYVNFTVQFFRAQLYPQLLLVPVFVVLYIWLVARFKISPEDKIVLDKFAKKFKPGKKQSRVVTGKV